MILGANKQEKLLVALHFFVVSEILLKGSLAGKKQLDIRFFVLYENYYAYFECSLMVSDLGLETKGSRFESGC